MNKKISIIGAGSLYWSVNLIRDLCLTPEFDGSLISLMDINKNRLNTILKFAKRYSKELKSNIKFEAVLNRKESIKNADLVINIAMAKGHKYYEKMRRISEKYGYYRGINSVEWNMVSDYHTIWGFYQFLLAFEIAKDIEMLGSDAWLIQLSNPVLELTTMIARETKVKVIGVCHGHQDAMQIINAMELDKKNVDLEAIGLNHTIWMTKFKVDGTDGYPLFDEWIDKKYNDYYNIWSEFAKTNPLLPQMSPAMMDMYKIFGLVPIGDTVRSGTWKYHRDLKTKKKWYGEMGGFDSFKGWNFYLNFLKNVNDELKKLIDDESQPLKDNLPPVLSDEPVVPILNSLLNNKKEIHQVNVLNEGTINGIPGTVAVEIPAVLDEKGIHKGNEKFLPPKIIHSSILPRIMRMEWAIDAFLEGGRQTLEIWLENDQRTKNSKQINDVIDAILKMPENEEMARHFR
ncbi:MAG: alpha-glucosidase/alpha-galactosidase, partial [Thermoplasmata archaeon]